MGFFLSKKTASHEASDSSLSHLTLATAESRLYASAIDMALLAIISFFLHAFFEPLFLVLQAVYFVYFWRYQKGITIGNRLFHIQVVAQKGTITLSQAMLRFIVFLFSLILLIGIGWILFDKKKQGWHDKIAKTIVIKTV